MESQGREGAARILRSPSSHKALCSFYLFYFPFAHAPRRANEKESLHTHTHAGAGRKAEASFVNEISRRHKAVKREAAAGHPSSSQPWPQIQSLGQVTRRADAQRALHHPPPTTPRKTKANTNNAAKKHSQASLNRPSEGIKP